MKTYVKPVFQKVTLTVEEKFAAGSCRSENGICTIDGVVQYWS